MQKKSLLHNCKSTVSLFFEMIFMCLRWSSAHKGVCFPLSANLMRECVIKCRQYMGNFVQMWTPFYFKSNLFWLWISRWVQQTEARHQQLLFNLLVQSNS